MGSLLQMLIDLQRFLRRGYFKQLAKNLENASPLKIMDKALEKFGNDIATTFRSIILSMLLNAFVVYNVCIVYVGLPLFSLNFFQVDYSQYAFE